MAKNLSKSSWFSQKTFLGTPISGERIKGRGNYFLVGLGKAQGFRKSTKLIFFLS